MADTRLLDTLLTLKTGSSVADMRAGIGGARMPALAIDSSDPDRPLRSYKFPDLGIVVFVDASDTKVDTVLFQPAFTGRVHGIAMGMTGEEVEATIGGCDRTWPMPHPNYVLLYDSPEFFRVDLARDTERVIAMYR